MTILNFNPLRLVCALVIVVRVWNCYDHFQKWFISQNNLSNLGKKLLCILLASILQNQSWVQVIWEMSILHRTHLKQVLCKIRIQKQVICTIVTVGFCNFRNGRSSQNWFPQ